MNFLRTYATPLSLVTGLAVSITGLMLLFGVRGPMGDVHEWIGVAFVAAIVMHIVRNWKAVGFLFHSKASAATAIIGGIALTALIVVAFPAGGGHGDGHGSGHSGGPWTVVNRVADAPISASAPALGLSPNQAVAKLQAAGVPVEGPKDSLTHLARDHGQPLQRLYGILIR